MAASAPAAWQRLGEWLQRCRVELDPRYQNLSLFCQERGIHYRVAWDIENARRTNYRRLTKMGIEVAYGLKRGDFDRLLAEFTPKVAEPPSGEDLLTEIGTRMLRRGATEEDVASLAEKLNLPRRRPTDLRTVEWRIVADALGVSLGTALIEFGVVQAAELAPGSPPPPPAQQRDRTRRRA